MGSSGSKLDKALAESPDDERFYGLENFGNTCYTNSVLQALYFCKPFRDKVLDYAATLPRDCDDHLLNCLAELFVQVGVGTSFPLFQFQLEHISHSPLRYILATNVVVLPSFLPLLVQLGVCLVTSIHPSMIMHMMGRASNMPLTNADQHLEEKDGDHLPKEVCESPEAGQRAVQELHAPSACTHTHTHTHSLSLTHPATPPHTCRTHHVHHHQTFVLHTHMQTSSLSSP